MVSLKQHSCGPVPLRDKWVLFWLKQNGFKTVWLADWLFDDVRRDGMIAGERAAKVRSAARLDRPAASARLRDLRRQNSSRLLRERAGAGVRALRNHLRVPSDDGLQRLEPRLLLRDLHEPRGRQACRGRDEQLWDPPRSIPRRLHVGR